MPSCKHSFSKFGYGRAQKKCPTKEPTTQQYVRKMALYGLERRANTLEASPYNEQAVSMGSSSIGRRGNSHRPAYKKKAATAAAAIRNNNNTSACRLRLWIVCTQRTPRHTQKKTHLHTRHTQKVSLLSKLQCCSTTLHSR